MGGFLLLSIDIKKHIILLIDMRKAAKGLLIAGGVINILLALLMTFVPLYFYKVVVDEIISVGVNNPYLFIDMTVPTYGLLYALFSSIFLLAITIMAFLYFVLFIISAILAFVGSNMKGKKSIIGAIVFGFITLNVIQIIGGFMAISAINKEEY